MSSRKNNRRKQARVTYPAGITRKTYNNLKREAKNARARIKAYAKKTGDFVSAADAYTLDNLLQRIANGETSRSVLREVRNLRGDKISNYTRPEYKTDTDTGEVIDVQAIRNAVNKANRAIDKAKKKYADFSQAFPEAINAESVISYANSENYDKIIAGLKEYNARTLKPFFKEGFTDVTTVLQYQRDIKTLEEENKRRAERRRILESEESTIVRKDPNAFDPINIDKIRSFRELNLRANTWGDLARSKRAEVFVDNYETQLLQLQQAYIENGFFNTKVGEMFNYIFSILKVIRGNADLVSAMSMQYREIDIQLLYDAVVGQVDFSEIYNDFCEFADEYLSEYVEELS